MVADAAIDAREAARRMMGRRPGWIAALMALRDRAVAPLGLKTSGAAMTGATDRIGIFPIVSQSQDRVVVGLDDKHLDFRVIVDVAAFGDQRRVTLTTLVRTHNLLGRAYLASVLPFHRIIARTMLQQVALP